MIFITKILNWLGSGFFRKIGSFLAWFVIGLLLFSLLNSMNIKLPKIIPFFVTRVNAATNQSASYKFQVRWGCATATNYDETQVNSAGYLNAWTYLYPDNELTCPRYTNIGNAFFRVYAHSSGDMISSRYYTITFKQIINCSNRACFMLPLSRWKYELVGYNGSTWGDKTRATTCNTIPMENQFEYLTTCTFQPKETLQEIFVRTYFNGEIQVSGIGLQNVTYYTVSNGTLTWDADVQGSINQQSQIIVDQSTTIINNQDLINNSINNLNDNLNNTDVSSSVTESNNFLNNFSSNSENYISQLVSLPFTFLQSLTLNNARDLCFNLKNKLICIPNGQTTIWSKDFGQGCHDNDYFGCVNNSKRDEFKTFFNIVVGGILAYKIILDLIRKVHEWITPDKDVVEVMKL